jgi:hypothetical protein
MPAGAKPGERRGGRQKGSQNKLTAIQRQTAAAIYSGAPNPPSIQLDILEEWRKLFVAQMGQAARVQGDPAQASFFNARLAQAQSVLKDMAPYRLYRKLKVAGDDEHPPRAGPTLNLTILSNEQLLALRPVLELLASQVDDVSSPPTA